MQLSQQRPVGRYYGVLPGSTFSIAPLDEILHIPVGSRAAVKFLLIALTGAQEERNAIVGTGNHYREQPGFQPMGGFAAQAIGQGNRVVITRLIGCVDMRLQDLA